MSAANIVPLRQAAESEELAPETELDLASEFSRVYGAYYRHTPGMGWMTEPIGAERWRRDDQMRRYDDARSIALAASIRAQRRSEKKALGSAKTVGAIVTLAASDPSIALAADAWDADPFTLNTPGGVVDLKTGVKRDRTGTDYLTQCTRVECAPEPACPTWQRFLQEVFLGETEVIEFMQRWVGYTLTGDRREQMLAFCHGAGANGKSTLWDTVGHAVGSYALKLPAQVLMQSPLQSHPTELAQLHRVRLALSSELEEGHYWAESRIKELTGDGVLRARYMRQDFFEFPMTQKHVILGNFKPRLKGGDYALARRFLLVPFRAKFMGAKRDDTLMDRLRAEAPAILTWAVQGAVKWRAEGLAIPSSIAAASAEYMRDNDDLSLWLDERCCLVESARSKAADLYKDYAAWLRVRGQQAPSQKRWADRMAVQDGVTKLKSCGVMVYRGIGLVEGAA